MNYTWIIESRVHGLDADAIACEVSEQGMDCRVVRPNFAAAYPNDLIGAENIPQDANVIFTGTLNLFRYLTDTRNWTPMGWCDFEALSCSTFGQHFHAFMLNQDFQILTINDAVARESELYRELAVDHKFFVRPDSVDKLFTGQIVDIDSFSEFLQSKTDDHTRKILVGKPMPIEQEWRLFIANDQIVDGCQYLLDGEFKLQPGVPQDAVGFVANVFSKIEWRPHPLFVMDICRSNGEVRIVEFNSYNCAGLLKCDIAKFVRAASAQAQNELVAELGT